MTDGSPSASTGVESARLGPRPTTARAEWVAVGAAILMGLMVVGVISPLLAVYQQRDDFGEITATVAFGCYAIGVITGLQTTGRLTDARGSRAVLVPALILAATALGVLLISSSLPALVIERLLSGVAAGMINQAGASAVLRLRHGDAGTASATTATLANVGLGLGPVLGGTLATVGDPLRTPIAVLLPLVLIALVLQRFSPHEGTGAPVTLRPIGFSIPKRNRSTFVVGVITACASFSVGGFVQGVAPTLLADDLGITSTTRAGITVGLLFLLTPAVVFPALRLSVVHRCLLGLALLVVGLALLLCALVVASYPVLLAAMVVGGAGLAASFAGGLTLVSQGIDLDERGAVLGLTYTAVYLAFVVPSIGYSLLATVIPGLVTAIIFAALVASLCVAAATVLLRRPPP